MPKAKINNILYIDGSNLYGGLTDLLDPGEYLEFDSFLSSIEKDIKISKVKFYGTYMTEDSSQSSAKQLIAKAQIEFFNAAKNHPKVEFIEGHFSKTSGKEKGVDVKLAVDLALGACTNEYTEAIIMTGDADLSYAVKKAKELGKQVHLAAFASRFPYGFSFMVNKRFVYDYRNYFTKKALPLYAKPPRYLNIRDITKEVKKLHV